GSVALGLLPLQQEEAQRPGAAAQIAYPPPAAHRGEPAQGQTVAPQGKAILHQKEGIAAQPLCALYGLSPPFVVGWEKREKERSYGDSSRHRSGAGGRLRSARLFSGLGRG